MKSILHAQTHKHGPDKHQQPFSKFGIRPMCMPEKPKAHTPRFFMFLLHACRFFRQIVISKPLFTSATV